MKDLQQAQPTRILLSDSEFLRLFDVTVIYDLCVVGQVVVLSEASWWRSVTVQTHENKQTKTVTDISTPCLSACVDKKKVNQRNLVIMMHNLTSLLMMTICRNSKYSDLMTVVYSSRRWQPLIRCVCVCGWASRRMNRRHLQCIISRRSITSTVPIVHSIKRTTPRLCKQRCLACSSFIVLSCKVGQNAP